LIFKTEFNAPRTKGAEDMGIAEGTEKNTENLNTEKP